MLSFGPLAKNIEWSLVLKDQPSKDSLLLVLNVLVVKQGSSSRNSPFWMFARQNVKKPRMKPSTNCIGFAAQKVSLLCLNLEWLMLLLFSTWTEVLSHMGLEIGQCSIAIKVWCNVGMHHYKDPKS